MEQKFAFEFNVIELNIIIKGLKELAYKESSGLIQRIIDTYENQAVQPKKNTDVQKNVEIAKQVAKESS